MKHREPKGTLRQSHATGHKESDVSSPSHCSGCLVDVCVAHCGSQFRFSSPARNRFSNRVISRPYLFAYACCYFSHECPYSDEIWSLKGFESIDRDLKR
jgi:hypothetical protein